MSAMLVLIGFSLTVAIGFLIAFLWAVKSGQYDDKYTPSLRILFDEPSMKKTVSVENNNLMRTPTDTNIKLYADDNKPQNSKNSNKQIKQTNQ